ncbi:Sugar kinase of the NBD/HSP70 family, may contain an N-terminal HTH domain [Paraoerskovia marina]|uniref:Sugar kinase of the NBD/HSP70 family, may contain an N-terminal HTH domain n=1 Tax=Paraoerskovia marina TaxID=545619 RepID=A0A1H1PAQ9_9CELL|nr:ROK family transcriptional regulator [Paraoerskovia marina]SDS08366.1 Sugar kinase of the NBD/HSP70 family, may contain an N-terminal HTH domain [Paraoerskovia marina]
MTATPPGGPTDRLRARPTAALAAAVEPAGMRTVNRQVLLGHLYDASPLSRPQLARRAGLSQPTVLAALSDLERGGLVRAAGRPETTTGRPAVVYEPDPTAGSVTAVDIGRRWIRLAVADLAGDRLARLDIPNTAAPDDLVDAVGAAAEQVRAQAGITGPSTHTLIAAPGVFQAEEQALMFAAQLPAWQRPGLAGALAARIGGSFAIENDANLAAVAEHATGAGVGTRHMAYLHVGTGIGLGIIVDGETYQGATGAAGEIAFMPVGERIDDHAAEGRRGVLEWRSAADSVVRYAVDEGLDDDVTAAEVFRLAAAGDPRAVAAVETEARQLADVVTGVAALLDPEMIVVGGGVGQNLDALLPALTARMEQITPMRPNLVTASLGEESVLQGALISGLRVARDIAFLEATERLSAAT